MVPRFSIQNVFELKAEMDETEWGDVLAATAKDWMVPDIIEKSATYKRLSGKVSQHTQKQVCQHYNVIKPHPPGLTTYLDCADSSVALHQQHMSLKGAGRHY